MKNKKFIVAASILGALLCTNTISAMKYPKELKNRENLIAPLLPLDNKDEEQVSATETISVSTLLQQLQKTQPQIFFKGSANWLFRDITQTAELFSNNNPVGPIQNTAKNQLVLSFHDKNLEALQQRQIDFSRYQTIRLQKNGFESLNWLPRHLPELKVLNLSHNQLKSLDLPVMHGLTRLRLVGNPLTPKVLENAPWYNVPGLKKLYLPGEIETEHRQTIERVIRRHCPDVSINWR